MNFLGETRSESSYLPRLCRGTLEIFFLSAHSVSLMVPLTGLPATRCLCLACVYMYMHPPHTHIYIYSLLPCIIQHNETMPPDTRFRLGFQRITRIYCMHPDHELGRRRKCLALPFFFYRTIITCRHGRPGRGCQRYGPTVTPQRGNLAVPY